MRLLLYHTWHQLLLPTYLISTCLPCLKTNCLDLKKNVYFNLFVQFNSLNQNSSYSVEYNQMFGIEYYTRIKAVLKDCNSNLT